METVLRNDRKEKIQRYSTMKEKKPREEMSLHFAEYTGDEELIAAEKKLSKAEFALGFSSGYNRRSTGTRMVSV